MLPRHIKYKYYCITKRQKKESAKNVVVMGAIKENNKRNQGRQ